MIPSDPPSFNGDGPAPTDGDVSSPSPQSAGPSETDRRSSPRRKKLLPILVRDEGGDGRVFNGWIEDRSLGGMCLLVTCRVEAGAVVSVRCRTAVDQTWVELRVLNVRQKEAIWEAGCEYVRTPSWAVMLQFE